MFENFKNIAAWDSVAFMMFVAILVVLVLILLLIQWQKKAYSKYADTVYGLLINIPYCYQPWRVKELWLDGKTPYQAATIMKAESNRTTDNHN